jgi:hypothetical protein
MTPNETNEINYANETTVSFDSLIDKDLLSIEVLIMTLVFVLALVGNSIVVVTILFKSLLKPLNQRKATRTNSSAYFSNSASSTSNTRKMSSLKISRMNFFILNLSLADIYVSLGNVLTMLLWRRNNNLFYGGDLACRLVAYFQLVSVYYSTYVLITMTLDRFEAICRPFKTLRWSYKRGMIYIIVAFLLAHLQGIPQIVLFSIRTIHNVKPQVQTCFAVFNPVWLEKAYIVYTFLMQFLLPLIIIVTCYFSISLKVIQNARSKSQHGQLKLTKQKPTFSPILNKQSDMEQSDDLIRKCEPSQASFRQHCSKNFSKSKMKTIRLTLTVIVLYIICSTPYFLGIILNLMLPINYLSSKFISLFLIYLVVEFFSFSNLFIIQIF